jgi:hypothetical protein
MRKISELENNEARLSYLIGQLKNNLDTEEINRKYNRLLVERASVRKKIKYSKTNNVLTCFCEKLSRRNKEKRICDFF